MQKFFLFMMICGLASSAHGFENGLKIIGKGVMDSKTGDSLAIACVGKEVEGTQEKSCNQVQHVFFNATTKQIEYVGQILTVSHGESVTDEQVKDTLKQLHRDYLQMKRQRAALKKSGVIALGGAGVFFGAAGLGGVGAVAFLGSFTGAGILIGFGAGIFVFVESQRAVNFQASQTSQVFVDHQGWSWSQKPRKASHRNFRRYLEFLKAGAFTQAPLMG